MSLLKTFCYVPNYYFPLTFHVFREGKVIVNCLKLTGMDKNGSCWIDTFNFLFYLSGLELLAFLLVLGKAYAYKRHRSGHKKHR